VRVSTEILYRSDANVFSLADGSIRQRPLLRGRAGIGGVPSPGQAPQGWPRNRRELPISSHTRRTASGLGREVRATEGRPEEARRDGRAVLQPHTTDEGGELQGSRKGRPQGPLEGRGKQAYESVERRQHETQSSNQHVHRHQQNS